MEIRHEWKDGPEILFGQLDDCANELHEIRLLEPILNEPEQTGTATDDQGNPKKSNRGVFFNEVYQPRYAESSPISKTLRSFIEATRSAPYTANSAFQSLYCMGGFDVLCSAYKNGDHYKAHRDSAKLTVLFWLGEKNFEGGDLHLPDFDYTIPYEPNKIFMFPSYYQHEVTPISTDQEGFVRYCASAFIN